jgi:poly-beta-hydroxyalkanoate depolymerase
VWHTLYEINRASLEPLRLAIRASGRLASHPLNPFSYTPLGRSYGVACEAFDRIIGSYGPRRTEIPWRGVSRHAAGLAETEARLSATVLPFIRRHRAAG